MLRSTLSSERKAGHRESHPFTEEPYYNWARIRILTLGGPGSRTLLTQAAG